MKKDKLTIAQGMVDQGLIGAAATQPTRVEGATPLEDVGPYRVAAGGDVLAELRTLLGDGAARLENLVAA